MIRKILLFLSGSMGLSILIILLFYRQEAYQLYKVVTFFDKDSISSNFEYLSACLQATSNSKPF